MDKRWMNYFY